MSRPADRLESEVMKLPPRERARLATRLIESLAPENDPSTVGEDRSWADEIERRAERAELLEEIAIAERQIERGEVVDHETAKGVLLRRLGA